MGRSKSRFGGSTCLLLWAVIAAGTLVLGSSFLMGQSSLGTILGRVTDPSGAVVPNAEVILRNVAKGVTATTRSNGSGDYVFSNVIPDTYRITVTAGGFKEYEVSNVVMYVGQTIREDATLAVGGTASLIQVKSELPLVQTDTTSVGSVIDSKQIEMMPLNGRTNVFGLLALAPGVQGTGSNARMGGNSWAAGTNETMDGVTSMEMENERLADATPSLDSVGEFRVVNSTGSAEYAGTQQVIVSTKSGTNEYHGSLFAYNEVAALEAANFFATSLPKAPFVRNEYGGSLGGPIKRDKLFFFGSFEGYKLRSSSTVQSAQPTPALLEGNFDGLPPVIDPSTGQPFPGNQVPSDRISPISQALFKYFDTPNLTSSAPGGLGTNFVSNIPQIQDNNRWEGRVDYNADSKDTFSARYYMVRQIPQLFPWGTTDKVGSVYWDDVNQNLVANYTRIISPKLVNLATFGWAREWDTLKSQNTNFDPSTLIPGLPASLPGLGGVPTISITAFTGLSDWGGSGDTIPTYEFHDTLTWVSGPHILKGGFSYLRYQFLNYQNISPSHGTFSFTGRYTGNPFADFLLGDISSDGYPISGVSAAATNDRYGLWVQDSWKAKPNLTLNLGLRYDLPTLYVNTPGNMANWYPSTNTVVAIKGAYDPSPFSALPTVSGQNAGINAGNYVGNDLRQLSPRVGIAYMPLGTSRLVLRGGYGLYYEMWPWNYGSFEIASNPPYGGAIYFEPQAGAVPTLTFANAFPAGAGSVPSGIGLTALARNYSYPASHEWNLTLESQVSANVALRASYLGTETQHASLTYNINDPIPAPGPVQPRRPFQPFGPINYYQNGGTSNLQQLQLSAIRRFSSNLSFEVEYSWTKELDLAGNQQGTPIDNQNIRLDRGNDPFIRPQYLVANYVYNLPFGSGQRFLSSLRGPLNQIIGGWQTSGILTLGSGLPFSVKFDSSVEGWPSSRADIIGNPHVSNPSLTQWFNPAAYALPEPFAYGNSAPYSLFGPGYSNWDMAMFKEFRLGERFRLQFRSEFFNTLNHPSFSNPASDISAPAQIGQIFSTTGSPRSIQFGLRLGF